MIRILGRRPNSAVNHRALIQVLPLLAAAVLGSGYLFWTKPESVPESQATLALLICWVGLAPTFEYLRRRQRPAMPLMPLTGLYYAIAFGLPAFRDTTGHLR